MMRHTLPLGSCAPDHVLLATPGGAVASTHPRESFGRERAIEALARQFHVPIAHVAQLYEREFAVLTGGARITGFLPILTTRKVREILRQRRHPAPDASCCHKGEAR